MACVTGRKIKALTQICISMTTLKGNDLVVCLYLSMISTTQFSVHVSPLQQTLARKCKSGRLNIHGQSKHKQTNKKKKKTITSDLIFKRLKKTTSYIHD